LEQFCDDFEDDFWANLEDYFGLILRSILVWFWADFRADSGWISRLNSRSILGSILSPILGRFLADFGVDFADSHGATVG
jgi:hypothetical protein